MTSALPSTMRTWPPSARPARARPGDPRGAVRRLYRRAGGSRGGARRCPAGHPPAAVRPPAGAGRHRPARPAGQSAVPRRPPAGHGAAAARGRFPGGPLGGRRPIGYEAVQRYGQTSWQLASPEAAQSDWVGKEIKYWVSSKGTDRLLVVVTDGTWAWDNDSGDLSPTSTAANRALRGVFPAEPKYLDMTWARRDASITLRNVKFRDQVATLAAAVREVPKEEI